MPSRRHTRRAPRNLARRKAARQRKKIRTSHKPRLVRRYMRIKKDLFTRAHSKHSNSPNLHASNNQLDKSAKNPAPKAAASHNDVAADTKALTSTRPHVVEEITAVPNPTPETGPVAAAPSAVGAGSPLLGGLPETPTTALILPSSTALSLAVYTIRHASFSVIPPVSGLAVSGTFAVTEKSRVFESSSISLPIQTSPPNTPVDASETVKGHVINAAIIVLLTVGSALVLVGACIVIKMCTRPRRKFPVPSLPIIREPEEDEDFFDDKESPIFGGNERFSPMPGVPGGPTWTWVQYPHTKLAQPAVQTSGFPMNTNGTRFALATEDPYATDSSQPTAHSLPTRPSTTANLGANRRISIQSFASLYSPRVYANIGQAITQDQATIGTPFTADGHDVMKRSKSKTSPNRRSQLGLDDSKRRRESAMSCVGLAYDGEDVASPAQIDYTPEKTPVMGSTYEGRERIKSGYFTAGNYPRISTLPSTSYSIATATRINVGQRNSFSKDKYIPGSSSKRQRDTQALSYALGLTTPETKYSAQSPQPSLYPDDSMSVMDAKWSKKRQNEDIPDVPVIVPTERPSRTGLMEMDFGVSQMSLSALTMDGGDDNQETADAYSRARRGASTGFSYRNTDKPPRVPSPPPLPSLAQMALQQHNPEAYASYRSPTYSLYGLYESSDRKSVVR